MTLNAVSVKTLTAEIILWISGNLVDRQVGADEFFFFTEPDTHSFLEQAINHKAKQATYRRAKN